MVICCCCVRRHHYQPGLSLLEAVTVEHVCRHRAHCPRTNARLPPNTQAQSAEAQSVRQTERLRCSRGLATLTRKRRRAQLRRWLGATSAAAPAQAVPAVARGAGGAAAADADLASAAVAETMGTRRW